MSHIADGLADAIARYEAGAYADAAQRFAGLLDQDVANPTLLRLTGLALVRSDKVADGLPLLARARRLAWHEPLAHLHHGIGLLQAGQPARAAAVLRRAAMLAPANAAVWVNFSAALLALRQIPAARAAARRAIAADPRMAEARHALGVVHLTANDLEAARKAFRAALSIRKDFVPAWLDLGLTRYRNGNIHGAMEAMRKALALDPNNGPAEANLAAYLLLRGETEDALNRLNSVLARDPGCVPARLNLANAMLLDHKPAQVLSVLAGPPPPGREGQHWRAFRVLAHILTRRWGRARAELAQIQEPYGDAEIPIVWRRIAIADHDGDAATTATLLARLEQALQQEGDSLPEQRIAGHFELARFHGRRDRRSEAFKHWTDGHRLMARFQPFDRAQARAFTDTSIALFNAARLTGPHARNDDPAPVFIVGMPRSGTTLTEHILAAHAQVFGAGERPAVHNVVLAEAGRADDPRTVRRLAAMDADALTRAADSFLQDLHALDPAARYVVDKMPGNARMLGFLSLLLPKARFIHCRRDLRDIGLSIFERRFLGYHPYAHDLGDLGFAIAEHVRLMAHWRTLLGPRLIDVDLLDWVDDFDGTLTRLLGFLDLPHDPACERFYEQDRRVRTASAAQVRKPINRDGIDRYKEYADHLQPLFAELRTAGLIDADSE